VLRARIVASKAIWTDPTPSGESGIGGRSSTVLSPIAAADHSRRGLRGSTRVQRNPIRKLELAELITQLERDARQSPPSARALNADSNSRTASSTSSKSGTSPNNIDSRMAS